MQGFLKFGLVFLGGAILGALAKHTVDNNEGLRTATTNLLSRGIDMKDCVMSKVETLKETAQDLVAEAQNTSEKRKETTEA